jgi:hypothetical protein
MATTRACVLRPASASQLLLRSSSRRCRRSTSTVTRSEYRPDEQEEEVPAAARIFATGIGLMINAAGFAACYELSPSMRILAMRIQETQDPSKKRRQGEGFFCLCLFSLSHFRPTQPTPTTTKYQCYTPSSRRSGRSSRRPSTSSC